MVHGPWSAKEVFGERRDDVLFFYDVSYMRVCFDWVCTYLQYVQYVHIITRNRLI